MGCKAGKAHSAALDHVRFRVRFKAGAPKVKVQSKVQGGSPEGTRRHTASLQHVTVPFPPINLDDKLPVVAGRLLMHALLCAPFCEWPLSSPMTILSTRTSLR